MWGGAILRPRENNTALFYGYQMYSILEGYCIFLLQQSQWLISFSKLLKLEASMEIMQQPLGLDINSLYS